MQVIKDIVNTRLDCYFKKGSTLTLFKDRMGVSFCVWSLNLVLEENK